MTEEIIVHRLSAFKSIVHQIIITLPEQGSKNGSVMNEANSLMTFIPRDGIYFIYEDIPDCTVLYSDCLTTKIPNFLAKTDVCHCKYWNIAML